LYELGWAHLFSTPVLGSLTTAPDQPHIESLIRHKSPATPDIGDPDY
jgi:hypothetical protein